MIHFYNEVLDIMCSTLKDSHVLSTPVYGSIEKLERILEAEPNVGKQQVANLFAMIQERLVDQFEEKYLNLSVKECLCISQLHKHGKVMLLDEYAVLS